MTNILRGCMQSLDKVEFKTTKVSKLVNMQTTNQWLTCLVSEMLLSSIYLTMLQTLELSEAQTRLEEFCEYNSSQIQGNKQVKKPKKKSTKKLKRHEIRIKNVDQVPKIIIVVGDTLIVRDYIMNDLKHRFNLSI